MAAGPLSVPTVDRPRRADRRRARRGARRRHHPSRSEAGQHLRHRARRRQAARLRPGRDDRRRRRRIVGWRASRRAADQSRHRGRHGALHVAGAGARRSAGSRGPTSSRSASCSTRCSPAAARSRADRPPRSSTPSCTRRRPGLDAADISAVPKELRRLRRADAREGSREAAGDRGRGRRAPARRAERIDGRPRIRGDVARQLAGRRAVLHTRIETSTAGTADVRTPGQQSSGLSARARAGQHQRCHHGAILLLTLFASAATAPTLVSRPAAAARVARAAAARRLLQHHRRGGVRRRAEGRARNPAPAVAVS